MTEVFHFCSHALGFCGETHPSVLSFFLGHNETVQIAQYIQYLKLKYKRNVH